MRVRDKEREIFHPQVHPSDALTSQGWDSLKPGVWNSIQTSHMGNKNSYSKTPKEELGGS